MIRTAAVAGLFYPADPAELEGLVRGFLEKTHADGPPPKALIVPHAGYVYSGAVAATGYGLVAGPVRRVVLIGPTHRYPLRGVATHSADFFATPLGRIPLDRDALEGIPVLDEAHEGEHSLEVHLPFLQTVLGEFALVPLVVGEAAPREVGAILDRLWGGPETLIVVSSDLSHFHDYGTARILDEATAKNIVALRADKVGPYDACGCRAIGGLIDVVRRRGLAIRALDLRNSGDTAGPRDSVVGYGAFAVDEPTPTARG